MKKVVLLLGIMAAPVRADLILNETVQAGDCTVTPWPATNPGTVPCAAVGGSGVADVMAGLGFSNTGLGPIATFSSSSEVDVRPGVPDGAMGFSFYMAPESVTESVVIGGYAGTGFLGLSPMYESDNYWYPDGGPSPATLTFNGCDPSVSLCAFNFGQPITVELAFAGYTANYPNCGLCSFGGGAQISEIGSLHVDVGGAWVDWPGQSNLSVEEVTDPPVEGLLSAGVRVSSGVEPSTVLLCVAGLLGCVARRIIDAEVSDE